MTTTKTSIVEYLRGVSDEDLQVFLGAMSERALARLDSGQLILIDGDWNLLLKHTSENEARALMAGAIKLLVIYRGLTRRLPTIPFCFNLNDGPNYNRLRTIEKYRDIQRGNGRSTVVEFIDHLTPAGKEALGGTDCERFRRSEVMLPSDSKKFALVLLGLLETAAVLLCAGRTLLIDDEPEGQFRSALEKLRYHAEEAGGQTAPW
ncbi:MAG: hypothetical protein DCC75_06785 [Proteobacteria bacterium]|nr:MAG: hypothetical protein DCC75_06785 [Pseudomonadota bacterium]